MIYDLKKDTDNILNDECLLETQGDLELFFKNGKNKIVYDDIIMLYSHEHDTFYFIKNRMIYNIFRENLSRVLTEKGINFNFFKNYIPDGIVLVDKITKNKNIFDILLNGDTDEDDLDNNLLEIFKKDKYPTISFNCLSRFYANNIDLACKNIINNKLRIVDYYPDTEKKLTDNQLKLLDLYKQSTRENKIFPLTPPSPGYTLINKFWHRPATVLLKEIKKNGMHLLFGQDEGTYFGVELKGKPKTVNESFQDLMPKEIRNIKGIQRQGEWFAVPVKKCDFPLTSDFVGFISDYGSYEIDSAISLHRDNDEQSFHTLRCQTGRGGVTKNGEVYSEGSVQLTHSNGDHKTLNLRGLYKYVKNTAKRSFSQEGVD